MIKDDCHLDDARRNDLAAYALGVLQQDEAFALEAHLKNCEMCRATLRRMETALDILWSSVPQEPPPARVRNRLMATVRAEAEAEARAVPTSFGDGQHWWGRVGVPALRPAMALAACVALAAGIVGGYLIRRRLPDSSAAT